MKRIVFPKYTKFAALISALLICVYILVIILEKFNTYIYLFNLTSTEIIPFVTLFCIALISSAVIVLLYKNVKNKALIVPLALIISFFIFFYALVDYALSPSNKYFEYMSDDKKHSIIVNEQSFLLSGGGVIYEKNSFCTMKRVGGYSTDDGFRPFSNDTFYFVWNENNFELHHSFYGSETEEYKVVKMKYIK